MELSGARTRNLFDPHSTEQFRLSRSKIELFLQCPRCFYLDRRHGVGQPSGPPFNLNLTVDLLLKREFDVHRARHEAHALMHFHDIDAIPLDHPALNEWRDARRGVQYLHRSTNFLVFGAVDDLWVDSKGRIIVVDYKATSSDAPMTIDTPWKKSYKRQMEVYQWLLRGNGLPVSDLAYFVYVNADRDRPSFEGRLEFTISMLPYLGSDDWIDDALVEAKICLQREVLPPASAHCEWCAYRKAAGEIEKL